MSYTRSFMGDFHNPITNIPKEEIDTFITNGSGSAQYFLGFINYSVLHNQFRKFPYFTACNIDDNQVERVFKYFNSPIFSMHYSDILQDYDSSKKSILVDKDARKELFIIHYNGQN